MPPTPRPTPTSFADVRQSARIISASRTQATPRIRASRVTLRRRPREGRVARRLHPGRRPASRAASSRCRSSRSCPTRTRRSSRTAPAARARRSPRRRSPSSATRTSRRANPGFVRWKDLGYPMELPPQLTDAQRDRYSRHILLPEVGEAGQAKLLKSKVLLLGAGGLGSPGGAVPRGGGRRARSASSTRTWSTRRTCSGRSSTRRAASGCRRSRAPTKAIAELNPDVKVVAVPGAPRRARTSSGSSRDYDVIVDGMRQLPDALPRQRRERLPGQARSCTGSIFRFDGQVTTFIPRAPPRARRRGGPCYRCLYPEPPPPHLAPSCQEAGVLGILCGIIGTLQATEAIKLLLGKGDHARRPAAHLRQPEDEVPRAQAAPRPGLPGVRPEARPSRATSTTKGSARSAESSEPRRPDRPPPGRARLGGSRVILGREGRER